MTMTQKSKQAILWVVGSVLGGGIILTVIGMAAQFWISTEVEAQLMDVAIPDTTQLSTDVEVMKGDISNINTNVQTAMESQQRFEEIFMQYLQDERNR